MVEHDHLFTEAYHSLHDVFDEEDRHTGFVDLTDLLAGGGVFQEGEQHDGDDDQHAEADETRQRDVYRAE